MKTKTLLLAALLFSGLAMPLAGPLEGNVQLAYPLITKKLENIYIDARLYEYDPLLADAPGTLVDHVELTGIHFSTTADSLVDIHFLAKPKPRMKYYITARTYSKKGGTLYFYINKFQKIFEGKDTDKIDVTMTPKLNTKKPKGDPVKVGGNDEDGGEEKSGKIHDIHRAVEIEWEGTDGAEFALQKSSDLRNWETVDTLNGTGETASVFLRISGRVQFWRVQPE